MVFPLCLHALFIHELRQRRTVENKLCAGDERLEEAEIHLRQARQVASEAEARYDEVSHPFTIEWMFTAHYKTVHSFCWRKYCISQKKNTVPYLDPQICELGL